MRKYKIFNFIICLLLMFCIVMPVHAEDKKKEDEKTSEESETSKVYQPDFTSAVWQDNNSHNPFIAVGCIGQCTWFAWNCMSEFYGGSYYPQFSGNGYECAEQLVRNEPDKFSISTTPKAGGIVSFTPNHVGFVSAVHEDGSYTLWEANMNGQSESSLQQFLDIKDYRVTQDVTESTIKNTWNYPSATYAIPTDEFLKTANFKSVSNSSFSSAEQEQLKKSGVLKEEWQLKGMPIKSPFMKDIPVSPDLTTRDQLTYKEHIKLGEIQEHIQATDQYNKKNFINTIISIIGFLMAIYASLLLAAHMFDRGQGIVNFSLVSLLTFGKIEIHDKEEDIAEYSTDKEEGRHSISSKRFLMFDLFLILFSIGWLSGVIQSYSIRLVDFIIHLYG